MNAQLDTLLLRKPASDTALDRPAQSAPAPEPDPSTQLAQCLAQLRAASSNLHAQGGFPTRARQLLQLCEHLQLHRESLMHAGWLAGYAPWDQRLDFEAGLVAVRGMVQQVAHEWADAPLVSTSEPQALDKDGRCWSVDVLGRAEGVDVLVLGLHRPCAHLLLGFASAWLAGRSCLVISQEEHPLLDALLLALRRGLPHGGAALRWMVGVDMGLALAQLQAADHLRVWSTPVAGEVRWEALQGCAAERDLHLAAPGLAVLDEGVEPGSAMFESVADLLALGAVAVHGMHEHAVRSVWLPQALLKPFSDALQQRWQAWQGSRPSQHWQSGAAAVQRLAAQSWIHAMLEQGACLLAGAAEWPAVLQLSSPTCAAEPGVTSPPLGPVLALWAYADADELRMALEALHRGRRGGLALLACAGELQRRDWGAVLARHHRALHLVASQPTAPADQEDTLRGAWELLASMDQAAAHAMLKALRPPCVLLAGAAELGACLQQHLPGSPVRELEVHPFRRHFEDLRVGDSLLTHRRTVTEADIAAFGGVSGDYFYMHFDAEAAAASPFGRRIAHGYFVLSAAAGLFVWPGEGPVLANYGLEHLRFIQPVGIGDTIQARLTCKRKLDKSRPGAKRGQGVVAWDVLVCNQRGEAVLRYEILTLVAKRCGEGQG